MMKTAEYQVTGMTCGHCEASVREEVAALAGVDLVEVSASTGRLAVTGPDEVADAAITEAVARAGYTAVRA
jgi:copper chaperone